MASSTTVPISDTVSEIWNSERDSGNARSIQLAIKNEVCTLLSQDSKSGSVEDDFASLEKTVPKDQACYVLFREDGSKWIFVTYIPDCCTVREKTLYASALGSLRRDLGEKYFSDNVRFSSASEFNWSSYKAEQKPVECLNEREKHFKQLDEMEETARREMEEAAIEKAREKQAAKKAAPAAARPMPTPPKKTEPPKTTAEPHKETAPSKPATTTTTTTTAAPKPAGTSSAPKPASTTTTAAKPAATSKPSVAATAAKTTTAPIKPKTYGSGGESSYERPSSSVSALRHAFEDPSELSNVRYEPGSRSSSHSSSVESEFGNADALGGYHTVTLPFSPECQEAFDKLKNGEINTMSMRIEKETVTLVKAGNEPTSALPQQMDEVEPRFLLHTMKSTVATTGVETERTLFVYCCPDKSQPKLRMVYSTSKPSIVDEAENHGITVSGKMEIRSGSELTTSAVTEAVRPRRAGAGYGYNRNARTVNHAAETAVSKPHPVYSKIAQNRTGSAPMKHIVLPPSSAY